MSFRNVLSYDFATPRPIESTIHFKHGLARGKTADQLVDAAVEEADNQRALQLAAAALHRARAEYFIGQAAVAEPIKVHRSAEAAVELIVGISADIGLQSGYIDRWRDYAAVNNYTIVEY